MVTDRELAEIYMDEFNNPEYIDKILSELAYPSRAAYKDVGRPKEPEKYTLEDFTEEMGLTEETEMAKEIFTEPSNVDDFIIEDWLDNAYYPDSSLFNPDWKGNPNLRATVMAGEEPYIEKTSPKEHWIRRLGDYITDTDEGFLPDVSSLSGKAVDIAKDIPEAEWDKIIPNAFFNIPSAAWDLATAGPQIGIGGLQAYHGEKSPMEILDFFSNTPMYPYEEEMVGDATAERATETILSELAAIPLMRKLIKTTPKMAQNIARQWMPGIMSEGWKGALLRSPLQTAGLAGTTAGLGTLFYSPPLNAGEVDMSTDREWEPWMEHSTSKFDLDNPNEMKNFEPRVIRSQNNRRGPGPWNEFRG